MSDQNTVHDMLVDVLVMLAGFGVPTPERTYKLDGGWTLALSDIRRCITTLRAELAEAKARAENGSQVWKYAAERACAELQEVSEQRDAAIARAEKSEAALAEITAVDESDPIVQFGMSSEAVKCGTFLPETTLRKPTIRIGQDLFKRLRLAEQQSAGLRAALEKAEKAHRDYAKHTGQIDSTTFGIILDALAAPPIATQVDSAAIKRAAAAEKLDDALRAVAAKAVQAEEREGRTFTWSEACEVLSDLAAELRGGA